MEFKEGAVEKSEFEMAVARATSLRNLVTCLGLSPGGKTYRTLKSRIDELGIDTSHFASSQKKRLNRTPDEILCYGSDITSSTLRKYLIKHGYKDKRCEKCGITEWMGVDAPLQLEHINGDNKDNRLSNLEILCANCHGITPTHSRGLYERNYGFEAKGSCLDCAKPITKRSSRCSSCAAKKRHSGGTAKIEWPEPHDVIELLQTMSFDKVGESLGVSGTAVRRFLKRTGHDPCDYGKYKSSNVWTNRV